MKRTLRRLSLTVTFSLLLTGCRVDARSPTIDVLGSYFPAWVLCIVVGLGLTLVARQILIGLKLDAHLRLKTLVYLSLMAFFTFGVWLLCFKS